MTRLIDADKLKDTILLQDGVNTKTWEQIFKFTFRAIDNAPTVEVGYLTNCANCERVEKIRAKRPHGKWKTIEGIDGDEYYECSNCGEPWVLTAGTPKDNNMNFCPNCGAKMDGGEEE